MTSSPNSEIARFGGNEGALFPPKSNHVSVLHSRNPCSSPAFPPLVSLSRAPWRQVTPLLRAATVIPPRSSLFPSASASSLVADASTCRVYLNLCMIGLQEDHRHLKKPRFRPRRSGIPIPHRSLDPMVAVFGAPVGGGDSSAATRQRLGAARLSLVPRMEDSPHHPALDGMRGS